MAAGEKAAPLTRQEIIGRLSGRLGLSAAESKSILEGFLGAVADQLEAGGPAVLSGLGRFYVRGPAPGPAKPAFALSRSLRDAMKKDHGRRE